ncbi:MAG: CRTAC1 family protein [Pseudomonadota bacterium]
MQEGSLTEPVALEALPYLVPGRFHGLPGTALLDYDNDGDLDIYVTNGPGRANSLYANQLQETGALGLVDVAVGAGVAATDQDSEAVCYGDIDNDGDQDLVVTGVDEANRLFVNNGDGTFDYHETSGLAGGDRSTAGCAMGDVDGDGLLDIVFINNCPQDDFAPCFIAELADQAQHNQLFINRGDLTFADASASSGFEDLKGIVDAQGQPMDVPGITWGLGLADVDADGDLDVLFADDQCEVLPVKVGGPFNRGWVHVMLNDGSGHFIDHPVDEREESLSTWMSIAFADYNCDGHLDIFLSSFGDYAFNHIGVPNDPGDHSSRWMLGRGDGTFDDVGLNSELGATPFGWGNAALDYDNDGDTDIVFNGGLDQVLVKQADNPGAVLNNQGCAAGGKFTADLDALPLDYRRYNVQGLAAGDLNGDGFSDFVTASDLWVPDEVPLTPGGTELDSPFDPFDAFVAAWSPGPAPDTFVWDGVRYDEGRMTIEINSADNGNGWIAITPVGSAGRVDGARHNRSGIGATVKVTPARGGATVIRPVHVGGYLASHAREGVFGLARARRAEVEIVWQGGVRNKLFNVLAGERLTLPEIPCSFDDAQLSASAYRRCVKDALATLAANGEISESLRQRMLRSAIRAHRDATMAR